MASATAMHPPSSYSANAGSTMKPHHDLRPHRNSASSLPSLSPPPSSAALGSTTSKKSQQVHDLLSPMAYSSQSVYSDHYYAPAHSNHGTSTGPYMNPAPGSYDSHYPTKKASPFSSDAHSTFSMLSPSSYYKDLKTAQLPSSTHYESSHGVSPITSSSSSLHSIQHGAQNTAFSHPQQATHYASDQIEEIHALNAWLSFPEALDMQNESSFQTAGLQSTFQRFPSLPSSQTHSAAASHPLSYFKQEPSAMTTSVPLSSTERTFDRDHHSTAHHALHHHHPYSHLLSPVNNNKISKQPSPTSSSPMMMMMSNSSKSIHDPSSSLSQTPQIKSRNTVHFPVKPASTGIEPKQEYIVTSNGKTKPICIIEGCTKVAQSRKRCKRHGGGPRCQFEGCSKSSQGKGRCRAHGGGKQCSVPGCTSGAQQRGVCSRHGGAKLCSVDGCGKHARGSGKCAMHGGGKRCGVEECQRSARFQGLCSYHRRNIDTVLAAQQQQQQQQQPHHTNPLSGTTRQ